VTKPKLEEASAAALGIFGAWREERLSVRVCLDCYQIIPYQFFGHDQKIGCCLDSCQFFGLPMFHYQL
jgi:hypothetical protein